LAAWDRLPACRWSFYILQVCHPERRLPESKDLAAAAFAAVILSGGHDASLIRQITQRAAR